MKSQMNGAESLVRTLLASGVDTCFANPGTSEMHFLAALDKVGSLRCVLGLAEGVLTGAADGYFRMRDRPACTLLHLAPGFANGLANLHNAKKAGSGIVNIVGEHATYHLQHDAPLTADIAGLARPMSHWVRTSASSHEVATDGAAAVSAAREGAGRIATLILPADASWGEADRIVGAPEPAARPDVPAAAIADAARALSEPVEQGETVLLLGGEALRERALEWAGRIAAKTGCRLLAEGQNARMARGAGRVKIGRLPFDVDSAVAALAGVRRIVLVGAKLPVAFFAYPGKPSLIAPHDCEIIPLADADHRLDHALEALAHELGAGQLAPAHVAERRAPGLPGDMSRPTPDGIAAVLAAHLPEQAIVVDEAVSVGRGFFPPTAGAAPHDWLNSVGSSLGYGLPVAIGAAIAEPQRKVLALIGDGSAMYNLPALWTMARERLDVTVVILANRAYNVLRGELARMGGPEPGRVALDMLSLDRPDLDFVALAQGHGVPARRAQTLDAFSNALAHSFAEPGPSLIELIVN
ncbi:acetolactate synthase large subunit [Paraburkholderia sp. ZP32-5]|uniref:acetolactate synthase large subunit n=1 Tax=Paraburkholderia sp. ZP32-5 TaxID=2883245 RepID=UPI002DD4257D|nr:acetolactate synthase large subunit [Paraburkholderia sp. ZP32-5]